MSRAQSKRSKRSCTSDNCDGLCMARQQEDGSYQCVQCNGDFYACDCPRRHSVGCVAHKVAKP